MDCGAQRQLKPGCLIRKGNEKDKGNGKERAADNDRGLRNRRVFRSFNYCVPGGVH